MVTLKDVSSKLKLHALAAGVILAVAPVSAQTDTRVESSRPVVSNDGKRTVVIDRLTPVVDGEAERFSGRMLIRVTSTDGSPARQRYLEASQVRVVQPPVWLDGSRVCAFVYNVAKNSNGIVYFEPETNRALQVEFVMPARKMAASGKVEQELTSLEVTEFDSKTMKIRNVPWKGGSAFPLVLDALPDFTGQPYDASFLKKLDTSITAYKQWLADNKLQHMDPEQASEAFSDDNNWLGLLACGHEGDSYLMGVPLKSGAPAEVLSAIKVASVKGVELSCAQHTAGDDSEAPVTDNRFLTDWKSPSVLQVIKESYDAESDEAKTAPLMSLNVETGALTDTASTATAAKQ